MNRTLTKIWIILILTACQINKNKQAEIPLDIKKSDCNFTYTNNYSIDTIIQKQNKELEIKTINENFKSFINEKIQFLNSARKSENKFFPYTLIDSVVYISYDKYDDEKQNFELNKRKQKFVTVLCQEKIKAVIDLINDPNNFGYGECGTPIPEAQILFYFKNIKVGELLFSCGHGQLHFVPNNILANFGVLNKIGNKRLDEIAPWK